MGYSPYGCKQSDNALTLSYASRKSDNYLPLDISAEYSISGQVWPAVFVDT